MAGFDNNIMYADNVDFTGSTSPSAQVTTDGELLIGSTAAPNIRVGSLASSGGTITITAGSGTINLDVNGSSVGQTITGDAGGALSPTAGNWNIVGGTGGISTSGTGSTLTINSTGGGLIWTDVTGTSDTLVGNEGFQANNAGLVTLTLPATCAFGDVIRVAGLGAGGWRIAQLAGQTIHFGNQDTTTGAGGMLDSTNRYDMIELFCAVANLDFTVLSAIGNITVT